MTRRELIALLAASAAPVRAARSGGSGSALSCEYRAKATVSMLSIPLFSREGVGGGYLRIEEREDTGRKHIRLEFGAGSFPDKAAGLNRLGMFEESIVEDRGELESASYFGFMTSSAEKNLDQARSALKQNGAVPISAIRGRILGGKIWNRLVRIAGVPGSGWDRHAALAGTVRERFETEAGSEAVIDCERGMAASTFLYAVRRAMVSGQPRQEQWFVHNGELLRLRAEVQPDPEEGAKFAERRLAAGEVAALTGRICSRQGSQLSEFRLWFEPGAAVPAPIRFEFRPRSFLRLAFERTERP